MDARGSRGLAETWSLRAWSRPHRLAQTWGPTQAQATFLLFALVISLF